jgi:hypothetical protein
MVPNPDPTAPTPVAPVAPAPSGFSRLIFLGGTAGNNDWRTSFIADAVAGGIPAAILFNPVVADWNAAAQAAEEAAKASATSLLFYIGSPRQEGNPLSAYSMVEATMSLYDAPERTVLVFDLDGIEGHPLKALKQMAAVLKKRFPNADILPSRTEALAWLIATQRPVGEPDDPRPAA